MGPGSEQAMDPYWSLAQGSGTRDLEAALEAIVGNCIPPAQHGPVKLALHPAGKRWGLSLDLHPTRLT